MKGSFDINAYFLLQSYVMIISRSRERTKQAQMIEHIFLKENHNSQTHAFRTTCPSKRQFVCWEAKQSKYPKALNVRTTMFTRISLRGFLLPTHATNLKLQRAFKEPHHYCGIYMLVLWGTVYCKCGIQERAGFSLTKKYLNNK